MIPRTIMYISVSCIILGLAVYASLDVRSGQPHSHRVLTRIVPIILDHQPVYPTNAAVIAIDPMQDYHWTTIELPSSWPLGQYYFEVWGADNRPLPGFVAQKLISQTIDIRSIDASLNPSVRVVVFQPPPASPLPPDYAVYMHYEERPNTRLFILVTITTLLYWTMWFLVGRNWSVWRYYPQQLRALLHGQSVPALCATVTTILFAGLFGVVLGSFIGGIQIVYVLMKIPLLMMTALLISFGTLVMLSWLSGVHTSVRQLWTVALNLLAITALGLAAFMPILEFYVLYPLNHDQVLIAAVGFFLGSGMLALLVLYRWLGQFTLTQFKRLLVPLIWILVYGMVFLQLGWMLRPWVGVLDPVHHTVPFARPYSGNVFVELRDAAIRLDGS